MASPAKQLTNGGYFRSRGEQIVNPVRDSHGGIQTGSELRSPCNLTEVKLGSWEFLQLNVDSAFIIAYKFIGTVINGNTCSASGYWAGANLKSRNFRRLKCRIK